MRRAIASQQPPVRRPAAPAAAPKADEDVPAPEVGV